MYLSASHECADTLDVVNLEPAITPGLFITFEGGEATGKTTQSKILAERIGALWTREPGGTELGAVLREVCLGERFDPSSLTELLLMAADRSHHVESMIRPTLLRGNSVVCDRYSASTIAYQGAGRGLALDVVSTVAKVAENGLHPDITVVIDVDDELRHSRLVARGGADRLEKAGAEFHARVAQSFRDQAASDPAMVVVDGSGSIDEVASRVWDAIGDRVTSRVAFV